MNPGPINSTIASPAIGTNIQYARLKMYTTDREHHTKGFITQVGATTYGAYHQFIIYNYQSEAQESLQPLSTGTVNWIAIGT